MSMKIWKLSPSDFAFLWEECQRCFYLKVALDFPRPRAPMPTIFTVIDEQMRQSLHGRRTDGVALGMPPGVFEYGERWVESETISVQTPDAILRCFVQGRFDTVVRLDDGTYAVVDFKTTERSAEQIPLYARQLHAYAWALEHPKAGELGLGPVTRLGLLVFEPAKFSPTGEASVALSGGLTWIEVERDDGAFLGFLAEALSVLEKPAPPGGAPLCPWCVYRDAGRRTGL